MPHNAGCKAGANPLVEQIFYDCVYNARDMFGFCIGLASIGCWVVAQVPQFIANFRNQRADALSPWFLAEWLMGDTCNLIGCLMTGTQLPTVTYTAMWFIFADVCLILQYTYFQTLQHRKERLALLRQSQRLRPEGNPAYRHAVQRPADESMAVLLQPTTSMEATGMRDRQHSSTSGGKAPRVMACLALLLLVQAQQQLASPARPDSGHVLLAGGHRHLLGAADLGGPLQKGRPPWVIAAGNIIGWTSSGFYLCSRLSQIYKNWRRKSAEGLSLAMFACAITANISYGLGIIVRSYTLTDIVGSAPWLLGSLGTVVLDVTIFMQGLHYITPKEDPQDPLNASEAQPLTQGPS